MKKAVCFLFALSLLVFCACGETAEEASDVTSETTDVTSEETSDVSSVPTANPVSDFLYEETDDGDGIVVNYIGESTDVVIPETIDGKPVTEIGNSFTYGKTPDGKSHINLAVTSVWMPDTVRTIGYHAFEDLDSLESVRLSEGLQTIGINAFRRCTALKSITLPEGLKTIETGAFESTTALKEITIPKSVVEIQYEAFLKSSLEKVTFEEGIQLERITDSVFAGTNLKEITLPASVKKLDRLALGNCPSLTKVVLNDGLEQIGDYVVGASGVTELVVPASVTDMTYDSFLAVDGQALKVYFEGDLPEDFFSKHILPDEPAPAYPAFYLHEGAKGFDVQYADFAPIETW